MDVKPPPLAAGSRYVFQGAREANTLTAIVVSRGDGHHPYLLLAGVSAQPGAALFATEKELGVRIGTVRKTVIGTHFLGVLAEPESGFLLRSVLSDKQSSTTPATPDINMQVNIFAGEGNTGYVSGTITQVAQSIALTTVNQQLVELSNCFLVSGNFHSGFVGALIAMPQPYQALGFCVGQRDRNSTLICLPLKPLLEVFDVELATQDYLLSQKVKNELTLVGDLSSSKDSLGFADYVTAFVNLIEATEDPLTIGVHGAWGTGKSSFMTQIMERLQSAPKSNSVIDCGSDRMEKLPWWQQWRKPGKMRTHVISFKAWDYNGTDKLWAGLVERIFLSFENLPLGGHAQLWRLHINLKRNFRRMWKQVRSRLLPYLLIVVTLLVGLWRSNQTAWATAFGVSSLLGALHYLFQLLSTDASQRIATLFTAPDYRTDLGFMGRIKEDLEGYIKCLPQSCKTIVFIDDLDRCDPSKAVEVLEAVKLLLEFNHCIVFVALEAQVLARAIEEHYGKVLVGTGITGYDYLDKIIQIPFYIPESDASALREYVASLVATPKQLVHSTGIPQQSGDRPQVTPPLQSASPSVPGINPVPSSNVKIESGEVDFTKEEQQSFDQIARYLSGVNPRRIKRLVNVYRLVRSLSYSARAKNLLPYSESEWSRWTLGWLTLCEAWPGFATAIYANLKVMDAAQTLKHLYELIRSAQDTAVNCQELSVLIDEYLHDIDLGALKTMCNFSKNFTPCLNQREIDTTLPKETP